MSGHDLRKAAVMAVHVWLAAAAGWVVVCVVAVQLGWGEMLLAWLPECPAHAAGGSCVLCGMTHSFLALSAGDAAAAARHNRAGPVLFLIICVLAAGALVASAARSVRCRIREARQ